MAADAALHLSIVMNRIVSAFCIWLIMGSQPAIAQTSKQPKPTLKEQVVLMAAGSVVEVELKNKQKIRGRIGTVTDDGFEVQHVQNDKAITQTIGFSEVKKIKQKEQGMSTGAKIALGALAGLGGFFLVVIIVVAAGDWD